MTQQLITGLLKKINFTSNAKIGALSIVGGKGFDYGLRLVANLIMTRLLYPEAFGLMLIVNTVVTGIQLLSDIGIRGSVILNSREAANEQHYLNVAWTMGVIRSVWVSLMVLLLAYPLSQFYEKPELLELFLVVSIAPLVLGFASPTIMTAERDIKFTQVILMQAIAQIVAFCVVIGWLLIHPTLYALACHGIVVSLVVTVLSYKMLDHWKSKFAWDRKIAKGLWDYGKWITLSTILTFLSTQGSKLLLGKMLTAEVLGLYSIASIYAAMAQRIVKPLGRKLLFPLYKKIKSEDQGLERIQSIRKRITVVVLPAILFLAIGGGFIIEILYDERYIGAVWILQLLASGAIFAVLSITLSPFLLANGNSRDHMFSSLVNFIATVSSMYVGAHYLGPVGLIIGVAYSTVFMYIISVYFGIRNGFTLRMYRHDFSIIAIYLCLLIAGWQFMGFFEILKTAKL